MDQIKKEKIINLIEQGASKIEIAQMCENMNNSELEEIRILIVAKRQKNDIIKFKQYIEWMENHRDEKTGEYRRPRRIIYEKGRYLKKNEMTEEQVEESKLGYWWRYYKIEKKFIESYMNKEDDEIPEKYRNLIKRYKILKKEINKSCVSDNVEENIKSKFGQYIEWIENHRDEKTGEYRRPRRIIYEEGRILRKNEMTEEQVEESKLGYWWRYYEREKKIIKSYMNKEDNEIPEKYRELIKRYKILEKNKKSKFEQYIEWIENHRTEKTEKYKRPRYAIRRNGRKIKSEEMTDEELYEVRLAYWWNSVSKERKILQQYENITEEEFLKLPENIQNIIFTCNKYGIKPKCTIVEKIRGYVRCNIENNGEIREELLSKVIELNEEKIFEWIKKGYNVNLIALEFDLPIEYVKECQSKLEIDEEEK